MNAQSAKITLTIMYVHSHVHRYIQTEIFKKKLHKPVTVCYRWIQNQQLLTMLISRYYTVMVLNDAVVGGKALGCVMEATEVETKAKRCWPYLQIHY